MEWWRAELLGRLWEVLCAPVCPVLHSLTCPWLQESPCDLFQCQELMEVSALSSSPLWHSSELSPFLMAL